MNEDTKINKGGRPILGYSFIKMAIIFVMNK